MYDDYIELRPGGFEHLENIIGDYFRDDHKYGKSIDAGPNPNSTTAGYKNTLTRLSTWCREILASGNNWSLPSRQPPSNSVETLGVCPVTPQRPQDHRFVLLCVPFMQRAVRLHQAEVCRINSDQEFFRLLRYYYASQRGIRSWARLRKVQSVNFVKASKTPLHSTQLSDHMKYDDKRTKMSDIHHSLRCIKAS